MNPVFGAFDASELAELVGGEVRGARAAHAQHVVVDTRTGVGEGDCFVCLRGARADGIRFAPQAFAAGCRVVVAGRSEEARAVEVPHGAAMVLVDDPLDALQTMAAEARRRFRGRVVAITGSNGKTIVKEMLTACLARSLRVGQSPASYNSQLGVALSLLWLDADAEVALIECGISMPGEMLRLEEMVRPDVGVFVNVGDAHLEGLRSRAAIAYEKAQLFRNLPRSGWVAVGEDQTLAADAVRSLGVACEVVPGGDQSLFELIPTPLHQLPHLAMDARLAAFVAQKLGATRNDIEHALAQWKPAQMRFEIGTSSRGVLLINDAWTSDPVSLDAALRALAAERRDGRAIAVLGGMAQLGAASHVAHDDAGRRVSELGIDVLIGVGVGGGEIARSARSAGMNPGRVHEVADVEGAAALLDELAHSGDRVLLKASRPERFERIAESLFDALAPTRLHVDLDAVVENYRAIRASAQVAVMPVIKSFGYGVDAVRLARVLERAGVEHFAVAYPDEGVYLREHGVAAPILVQNVLPAEALKTVRAGLTAAVWTLDQIAALAGAAETVGRRCSVHLKVDTGMNRAGIRPDAALQFHDRITESEWLVLDGVFTHLAGADDAVHDEFSAVQLGRLDAVLHALEGRGVRPRLVHAANSAGALRLPAARRDIVRAGIGLLGYVDGEAGMALSPVLRLVTQVISVHDAEAGESVGYGRSAMLAVPRRIAVVAIGYNDGYPRALSNRGWMSIDGRRCAVVGRVCMDVTMVDVTGVDGVGVGTEVVVHGPGAGEPTLLELARLAETIPYELLTRISSRVRRIFLTSQR